VGLGGGPNHFFFTLISRFSDSFLHLAIDDYKIEIVVIKMLTFCYHYRMPTKTSYSRKHTVRLVMSHFMTNNFATLVAPMQSGKTATYSAIAQEAKASGLVQQVVVFSGNREIDLRIQTSNRVKDFATVVWGADLKHFIPNLSVPTLYISDESHYGQSDGQEVDRFCARCSICPAGMVPIVGVYCLSVSATPFSEVKDAANTPKLVIFQKTSKKYYGIKNMLKNGRIKSFTDYSNKTEELLETLSNTTAKVGLFRVREDKGENKLDILKRLCDKYNLTMALYDASSSHKDITRAIETKPSKSHVVVVKGKLKMGKTINDKRHVMFCMDTATTSKADTLLQGFMGRFCGYNDPKKGLYLNIETCFYIHANNIDGPTDYVSYFDTLGVTSPKTGMNMVFGGNILTYAPLLKIPLVDKTNALEYIPKLNESLSKIPIEGYCFRKKGKMILEEGVVPKIQPGHGAKFEKEVNIYNIGEWSYLLYAVSDTSTVTTTKKEIFCKSLKMNYHNGFVIGGPRIESFFKEPDMLTDIHTLICSTKKGLYERKIQSKDGVRISLSVYESLNKGNIYKQMKKKEDVCIKVGRIISKDSVSVVVEDISW
jgi:hypothetical protein